MIKLIVWVLALAILPCASVAQSISGIRVGEPASSLEKLHLKPVATDHVGSMETVKYNAANGNELSVTYDRASNRIVYIESDWNRKPESAATDLVGFEFGVTTLEKIRTTNDSNGFAFKNNAMNIINGDLVAFNAFRIKDKRGLVAVFVTTLNVRDFKSKKYGVDTEQAEIPKNLKLDALILAEEHYLDQIWGSEKVSDKDAKPISWER